MSDRACVNVLMGDGGVGGYRPEKKEPRKINTCEH